LEASITGAGLILAVYALITPMSGRIYKELNDEINDNLIEFNKLKNKITPESKKEMKRLSDLRTNMERLKKFPSNLGIGVMITFVLYFFSVLIDSLQLINPSSAFSSYLFGIVFLLATIAFFMVGIVAVVMVFIPMQNEFEEITKRQKVSPVKEV